MPELGKQRHTYILLFKIVLPEGDEKKPVEFYVYFHLTKNKKVE